MLIIRLINYLNPFDQNYLKQINILLSTFVSKWNTLNKSGYETVKLIYWNHKIGNDEVFSALIYL